MKKGKKTLSLPIDWFALYLPIVFFAGMFLGGINFTHQAVTRLAVNITFIANAFLLIFLWVCLVPLMVFITKGDKEEAIKARAGTSEEELKIFDATLQKRINTKPNPYESFLHLLLVYFLFWSNAPVTAWLVLVVFATKMYFIFLIGKFCRRLAT